MLRHIKTLMYRVLNQRNYLRLLQRSYFLTYRLGLLRCFGEFKFHYFVKRLIRKGDVVIDIGANLGYYSIPFARFTGRGGHVYSVEPVKAFNDVFSEQARRYPQITLYPCALGTENKEIELVSTLDANYMRTGLFHVFQSDRDGSAEDFAFRFKARMRKASELFGNLQRIDYIKIDVEGFEAVILNDMKEIIGRCKPVIQAEIWEANRKDVFAILNELGYTAFVLERGKLIPARDIEGYEGDFIFRSL